MVCTIPMWQGNATTPSVLFADEETPLSEKLKIGHGEVFDPVPSVLLRKYIGYARKYVHPKLTSGAADVLKVCSTHAYHHMWQFGKTIPPPLVSNKIFIY